MSAGSSESERNSRKPCGADLPSLGGISSGYGDAHESRDCGSESSDVRDDSVADERSSADEPPGGLNANIGDADDGENVDADEKADDDVATDEGREDAGDAVAIASSH